LLAAIRFGTSACKYVIKLFWSWALIEKSVGLENEPCAAHSNLKLSILLTTLIKKYNQKIKVKLKMKK